MRPAPKYRRVHAASDKIEPRMARAIVAAADRTRERIPFRVIEEALARRDVRSALAAVATVDFADAYLPSAEILKEAVLKGGKVEDEEVR